MSSGGHGGHGKRAKKHEEEEHENHERWLVSYADMLTLLFVLFVVLFAISSVDQKKFAALKEGLADGFGAPMTAFNGGSGVMDDLGTNPASLDMMVAQLLPAAPGATSGGGTPTTKQIEQAAEKLLADRALASARARNEQLDELKAKLDAELTKKGLLDTVNTRITARGVVVTVVTSSVVFQANSATLREGGKRIIDGLVPVLASIDNDLSIEGSTDTTSSKPKGWASEYDLSAARGCGVVNYLDTVRHIPRDRMVCAGKAETDPLVRGTSARANTLNRRVDIVVLADEVPVDRTDTLTDAEADALEKTTQAQEAAQASKDAATEAATGATPAAAAEEEAAEPADEADHSTEEAEPSTHE